MKKTFFAASLALGLSLFAHVDGQETPIGARWWPSEWGPDDQRGAANRITQKKVIEAVRLISQGRVYSLGRTYEPGMPLAGNRHYKLTIVGSPTNGPRGENQVISHDEMFSGEIGQVGTQMDGLGHVGVRLPDDDYFYNGIKRSEMAAPNGLRKLGVEKVGVFFTRGVLIDVASYKNVERLLPGYVISVSDLEAALRKQGLAICPGDAVLIRTGHGRLWMMDNDEYTRGEPGIGMSAARWLTDQKIVTVGADTWGVEVYPPEQPNRPDQVHQWMIVRNGVYHLENLDLEELAGAKVYEFVFIFAPLPLKGATGSPGNPIAVR